MPGARLLYIGSPDRWSHRQCRYQPLMAAADPAAAATRADSGETASSRYPAVIMESAHAADIARLEQNNGHYA